MRFLYGKKWDKIGIAGAILVIIAVTVLRSIRMPNDWVEAHWLLHYDFGFLKRAAVGAVLKPFVAMFSDIHNVEILIDTIIIVQHIIFGALLFRSMLRVVSKGGWAATGVVAMSVFATSAYIVYAAHLIGYFDTTVILLCAAACLLIRRGKILLAAILLSLGIFIHEIIMAIGFPVAMFAVLLNLFPPDAAPPQRQIKKRVIRHLPVILGPPLVFLIFFLVLFHRSGGGEASRSMVDYLTRFTFIEHDQHRYVPFWCGVSFMHNLHMEIPKASERFTDLRYLFHNGLPAAYLLAVLGLFIRGHRRSYWIVAAAISAAFAPLLLHLIAFDTARIWSYPILSAYLCLWLIMEFGHVDATRLLHHSFVPAAGVILTVMNIFLTVNIKMLDGIEERFTVTERLLLYLPPLVVIVGILLFRARAHSTVAAPPPSPLAGEQLFSDPSANSHRTSEDAESERARPRAHCPDRRGEG